MKAQMKNNKSTGSPYISKRWIQNKCPRTSLFLENTADTQGRLDVGLMLGRCRRQRTNIKRALRLR